MGCGSSKTKVVPMRSRSGLSFVSTSSIDSLNTITSSFKDFDGVRNIKFDEVTTKSFRVGWDQPNSFNVASYQVRIFPPDKIKSRTLLRAHKSQTLTFTRLQAGVMYSVAVVAIDGGGNKSLCETASTFTLPRPPRDLRISPGAISGSIKIEWKHCKGKPGRYEVEVAEDENHSPTKQANGLTDTSKVFKDLMPGADYVVSVWNAINNVRSDPITGKYIIAPRHVANVTFHDVTTHEMTLKWKKPEGRVSSYTLELSELTKKPAAPVAIERLTRAAYTFNGLTPGRLYKCKIVANAKQSEGEDQTSKSQMFTQCTVPLEVAEILARDVGTEEALIKWSPGVGDADDYDLFLSPKEGVVGETSPRGITATQYKFKGLVPGTVYTVGIVTNSKDKSSKRNVSSFATAPGMVGDIEISDTDRSCTTQRIQWPSAAGRVDSYVINLRREDKSEEGKVITDVFQTHHLFNGLTPGTLYKVHVAAMRDGRESSSVTKTFGTVPAAVPSTSFSREKCSWDRIFCSWTAGVGGIDKYRVVCTSESGSKWETMVPPDNSSYLFTHLASGTEHEIAVSAISNGQESYPTKAKQVTGSGEVENIQVASTNKREVQISWTPPAKGAESYFMKINTLEEGAVEPDVEYSASQCTHTFTNLTPGSLYQISITPFANLIRGKVSTTLVYTKPGDVINAYLPEDKVTTDAIVVQWWGVEGNSKIVYVTLIKLKKRSDVEGEISPVVVKEEEVTTKDESPSQVIFKDLDPDTIYRIRLRAVGKGGVGKDAVLTQATKSVPVPEQVPTPGGNSRTEQEALVGQAKLGEEVDAKMMNMSEGVAVKGQLAGEHLHIGDQRRELLISAPTNPGETNADRGASSDAMKARGASPDYVGGYTGRVERLDTQQYELNPTLQIAVGERAGKLESDISADANEKQTAAAEVYQASAHSSYGGKSGSMESTSAEKVGNIVVGEESRYKKEKDLQSPQHSAAVDKAGVETKPNQNTFSDVLKHATENQEMEISQLLGKVQPVVVISENGEKKINGTCVIETNSKQGTNNATEAHSETTVQTKEENQLAFLASLTSAV